MKIKAIILSLALMLTLVSGYVIFPENDPFAIDVLAGASTVSTAAAFETQCGTGAVGKVKYICISTNVTVTKNISIVAAPGATTRTLALTSSQSGSPSFTLTIPLLILNTQTIIEFGKIVGNVFVNTSNCTLDNAIQGNVYFATQAIKNSTTGAGSISGTQTIGNPMATPSSVPTAPTATPTIAPTSVPTAVPTATPVHVTGVRLNKTSTSLKVKGTLKLTASVLPSNAADKSVLWRTVNLKIATIDSTGMITAKMPGVTTVTATTNDGSFVAQCKLTVTQPVTGVKLNKTNATILKGKTLVLKATVLPANASNKKVVWKSSNVKIATVSTTGKITAKAKGIAYVSVTTVDGKKLAKCKVTVK